MSRLQTISTHTVGREVQLAQLKDLLSEGTKTGFMTIEAPRGMGKSHLLTNLGKLGESFDHTLVELDFGQATELDTLYIIRRIRDQLELAPNHQNQAQIAMLNKAINEHTHSANTPTAIELDKQIQMVSVNVDELKQNLQLLETRKLIEISSDLNMMLPASGEPEKLLLVDHLLNESRRLDLLADLVVQAQTADPSLTWWQSTPYHPSGVADVGGTLVQNDLPARRRAIAEISRALFRLLQLTATTKPILLLIDGWNSAGDEDQKWMFHWLIKPLCSEQLVHVKMVVAGRDLTVLREIDLNASHTQLEPLNSAETRQLLIDKLGFHPDSDVNHIHEWTQGIPSVLETLIALNQIKDESD